jgi:hypothetical protein
MTSTIEKEFAISAKSGKIKTVKIVYDLTFYSEKKYVQDFNDFVDYQTGKEKFEKDNAGKSKDGDLQFYRLKSYPFIPYAQFLNTVSEVYTKVIFQILKEDSGIMVSDEDYFKITFILYRVANRNWYFNAGIVEGLTAKECAKFKDNLDTDSVEHIDYVVAGVYLIQTIAAPWTYLRKIPYSHVWKYLVHELEHHKQFMMDEFRLSEKIRARLKGREVGNYPNYRVSYLFTTMYELLDEGVAEFVASQNRPRIKINRESIFQFRKDLETLITINGRKKTWEFYEENLSYGDLTKGAYYCGRIMCFTIELAIAKIRNKPVLAYVGKQEFPFGDMNAFMSKYDVFEIGSPEPSVFKEAYEAISKTKNKYREYINLYEWACKELGIRESNMVISYATYDEIKKKATKFYERYTQEERAKMYEKIKKVVV